METNSVNTDLSEELLNSLAKEERTELLDFINNYPFINWMVSANRPYAKDVPKDKTGKIIVDVVKPHILENTNYFRKAAIAYKKYGRYTNLRPNGNPNSPYMKWLRKEVLKCWYGCKRPSDGEWITGYHYFYLNYSPIERSTSTVGDSKAVGRVVDFPDFYDLDYLFFHYVNQARYGGKYNNYEGGQHCGIIAARGKGKMIPNSTIVYTPNGYKVWKNIHPGDYLYGDDGKPTKVLEEFNHKSKPIYKLTLKDGRVAYAGLEHLWTIKYGDKLITVDTQWIIEHLHKDRIIIPLNKPVQIKERPISLDPFRYGLSIKTRVNDNYKYNSESIRRKVLEGILSRSKIIGFGTVKFTTKYSKLAEDVLWLGRSLGYICREEKIRVRNRTVYSVYVQNFYTSLDKYIDITNVEYSHNEDAKCVIVDNDSHLFLMNDFIVTHNSFKVSSMSARNFILGENMDVCEKVKSLVVASNTEYLKKDGTLNKTLAMADFLAKSTQFPSKRVKSSTQDMHWIMGYRDPKNKDVISGTKNEILGLSFNNDSDKGRGKRSQLIVWEEFGMFPNFLDAWNTSRPNTEEGGFAFGQSIAIGCVCAGSKVFDKNGNLYNIEDLPINNGILGFDDNEKKVSIEDITYFQEPFKKECVDIELSSGRHIRCSLDHPILINNKKMYRRIGERRLNKREPYNKFVQAKDINVGDFAVLPLEVPITSSLEMPDARMIGWMIGDGSYGIDKTPRLSNCEEEINRFIEENYDTILERYHITKEGKLYKETRIKNFTKRLRELGIFGQVKSQKRLPKNIHSYSKKSICELLGGLFDTDGHISKNRAYINITQSNKEILLETQLLLHRIGVYSIIRTKHPNPKNPKDKNDYYVLSIRDIRSIKNFHENIKLFPKYKQEAAKAQMKLITGKTSKLERKEFHDKIVSITNIGEQYIYNLTANNTHTYLVNGIVTHNTGGSESSDFSGALEMIYNPLGYNVYGIPNVYDKGASGGAKCIFFIGEYMNRKGCYDKDGNSDIVKAVLEEVKERVYIKYNSSDPSTIAQRIAEHPMSIQEAIMRRDGTLFPVADLTDHLNYIEANKIEWNRGHLVGELSQDPNGNISFKPTDDEPIRDFPLKDNRHRGALEIYELPKEVNGKVPSYRYIAGVDPIDDDHSTTVSLPSIIVLDMFTDRVVAEYTGRPDFADDFYEICRRLGIYYNALINYENDKKGLFTYFSNNHCTYLLAQTPEILRDTELVKSSLYGNKSFGTQSGKQVNAYARRLIRDWLLMPVKQTKIEIDENGNEVEKTVTIKNLQRLRGTAMIKELIMWNPDINADRVSALGMLMILRENNMKYLPGEGTSTGKKVRKNYLGNDPFFTNNFANTTFW